MSFATFQTSDGIKTNNLATTARHRCKEPKIIKTHTSNLTSKAALTGFLPTSDSWSVTTGDAYGDYIRCDSVKSDLSVHTITSSRPSTHFDGTQLRGRGFETPVVLYMQSSHPGPIYQQENARPHTARDSQQ
ncbi:uncharacterized protein TNCV_2793391 [Trichonephila clavipes]|nr:uncharacterized protein TNCV_2793391 [Trichonephila clavipes]